ncbi:nuclear transport factor 2 family protein [Rhizorhabdus wittichii]|uniref:Nuclear transport factor 2 family protein n=1 Tax=Rhizorhabdus wittichii TaxID=160791 RepID=A0A975CZF3_9SPHN|nr:nuclear transport factor 2 family protein [Rhizorhabdus wittichii]QTH20132.1 nuclear transport factor 2 family protein [Rhizorhabdus wittichii]
MSAVEQSLFDIEARRCAALVAGDLAALLDILHPDLRHVHATGFVDDRESYVEGIRLRLEVASVEWKDAELVLWGDMAVLNGALTNRVRRRGDIDWMTMRSLVTQVWRGDGGPWRLYRYHACRQRDLQA